MTKKPDRFSAALSIFEKAILVDRFLTETDANIIRESLITAQKVSEVVEVSVDDILDDIKMGLGNNEGSGVYIAKKYANKLVRIVS